MQPHPTSPASVSDAVQVDVRYSARRFDAEALLTLPADAQTVWDTITDYGALPRFMPGIRACRVVERQPQGRRGERLVVEQEGEFRFLLFAQKMKVLLHIDHEPLRVADARAVEFNLVGLGGLVGRRAIEIFEGRYELLPGTGRDHSRHTRLRYTAVIGLALPPPPAIGGMAVRQNLTAQLEAVAREVARRAGGEHVG